MEKIGTVKNSNLAIYMGEYWDIIVGVAAIIIAIILHKNGNGYLATAALHHCH